MFDGDCGFFAVRQICNASGTNTDSREPHFQLPFGMAPPGKSANELVAAKPLARFVNQHLIGPAVELAIGCNQIMTVAFLH
jgi:hypothetical protein